MSAWYSSRTVVAKAPGIGQGDREHDSVLRLYNEFERLLKIKIEAILGRAVSDQSLSAIIEAYQSGVVARVESAISFETIGAALGTEMGPVLLEAMRRGGEQALRELPGELVAGFDVTDPLAVNFIRTSAAESVVQITQETQAAIRLIIQRSYTQGLGSRAAAREIKSVIGLTRRQAVSVSNFRRSLIDAIETDAGPASLLRDFKLSRNVVNTRNMQLANVDRLTGAYQHRWIGHRSTLIARNEAVRAVSAGRRALWEQAVQGGAIDPGVMVKIWQTTPDARACPICLPLHGQAVAINEDFVSKDVGNLPGPPAHIACLPGDTYVTPRGTITAATKRWIDDELIVISPTDGLPLSASPNHPILTRRGWVPARSLDVSDEIAHPGFVEWIATTDGQDIDGPSRIEDIATAFFKHPSVFTVPMPITAPDFHGDGIHSEIAIVGTDRLLLDGLQAMMAQSVTENAFKRRRMGLSRLASYGALAFLSKGLNAISGGKMGVSNLVCPLCLRHMGPLEGLRLGLAAPTNASLEQDAHDGTATASEMGGDEVLRDPTDIHPDDLVFRKIESLGHRSYSGFVYNIETSEGIYIANGTVTHNCRCNTIIAPDPKRGGRPSEPQRRTDRRIEELREEAAPALEAAARARGEEV